MTSRRKKKGIGSILVGLTARTILLAFAGLLVLSYLSMFVNPARAWFFTIFGLLFLPLLVINVILLISSVLSRSKAALIPFVALLPALFLSGRYIQLSSPEQHEGEKTVKLVSYNVGSFQQYRDNSGIDSQEACMDSIFHFLKRTDADIISLQELTCSRDDDVKEFVLEHLGGYHVESFTSLDSHSSSGNVILTKYPVIRKGKFDFENSSNRAFYSDLDIDGEVLRVYDCHFQSYGVSVKRVVGAVFRKDTTVVHETEEKMRSSIRRRPEQVNIILKDIKESPVESIVTGDFNDTPFSYTYTMLKRGKKDSFVEAGKGMGGTYAVLRPFIRIDYVLFPRRFEAVSHKVVKLRWSDHYPIVTELKIN